MKEVAIFVLFLIGFATNGSAQNNEEEAIKKTVNNLFIGMKTGDSTIAGSAFADGCIMQTITSKGGKFLSGLSPLMGLLNLSAHHTKKNLMNGLCLAKY